MTITEPELTTSPNGNQTTNANDPLPDEWQLSALPKADKGLDATIDGDLGPVLDGVIKKLRETANRFPEQRRHANAITTIQTLQQRMSQAGIDRVNLDMDFKAYKTAAARIYALDGQAAEARYNYESAYHRFATDMNQLSKTAKARRQKELDNLKAEYDRLGGEVVSEREASADREKTYRDQAAKLINQLRTSGEPELADRAQARLLGTGVINPTSVEAGLTDVIDGINATHTRHRTQLEEAQKKFNEASKATKKKRTELKGALDALQKVRDEHVKTKAANTKAKAAASKAAATLAAANRKVEAAKATEAKKKQAQKIAFELAYPADLDLGPGTAADKRALAKARIAHTKATTARKRAQAEAKAAKKRSDEADALVTETDPDRRLLDAMAGVRKRLPKGSYDYATFEALETTAKVAVMDREYESVKRKLVPNFKRLRQVGSKDTTSVQLELGTSLNAILVRVDVTGITNVDMSVERTGSGKFKATSAVSFKTRLGVKGGVETKTAKVLIKGGIEAGDSLATSRTYDTLEDLVTAESSLIMSAVMTGSDAKANRSFIKERSKLLAQDYQRRELMWRRLDNMNALPKTKGPNDTGDDPTKWTGRPKRFKTHPRHRIDMVRTDAQTSFKSIDASTVASVTDAMALGGGLAFTTKNTTSRDYKTVSFIDDVMGNDGLQRLHAYANAGRFGFMRFDDDGNKLVKDHWGQSAVDEITKLRDRINQLKTVTDDNGASDDDQADLDRARKKLRSGLEMLRMEYDGFVLITNQMDDGQISKSNANKTQRDHFRRLRGLEKASRAEYVKAVSVQYAMMRDLYEKTFPNDANGKPKVPASDVAALDRFKDDLQTPRMKLSDSELRDAYGVDAVTDQSVVKNKSFAANFIIGASGKEVDKAALGGGLENKKSAKGKWGVNISASYSIDTKIKGGKKSVSSSLVFDIGDAGGFIGTDSTTGNDNPMRDTKWVNSVVGKLLSRGDLAAKVKNSPGLEAECRKAFIALAATGATVQFDFAEVHGKLRLKTAAAFDQKVRKVGTRQVIPTGTGVDVVVGMSLARSKKQVRRIYHASNTLGAVTDAYRSSVQVGDGTTEAEGWDRFKKNSGLLKRMVAQLGNDDFLSDESGASKQADRKSFDMYLRQIQNGEKMKGTDASRRLGLRKGKDQEDFGLINEAVDWLLDLKTSSDKDDQAAADDFIKVYLANRDGARAHAFTKHRTMTNDEVASSAKIEDALNKLILAKTAKEDRTAADDFRTKRGFNRADLNAYVTERLARHMESLVAKVVKAETGSDDADALADALSDVTSIDKLRKRVLRRYNADPTTANYELVSDALALDYVANSLDDLTKFNDEADKNSAIGMLGADLDDLLKKSKVYINDMIEADLSRDDDGLKLSPKIKKGMSKVVKNNLLDSHVNEAMDAITADATPESDGNGSAPSSSTKLKIRRSSKVMMISDYGGVEKQWSAEKHYDSKAKQEYFKKRGDKANYVFFARKRAKKNLRSRNKETSISAMLEKVMSARAETMRRKREQDKAKRKRLSSTSTGN